MKTGPVSGALRFLPLLAGYVALCCLLQPGEFVGDEGHYVEQASHLAHGRLSPPGQTDLWYGPGYPLALLPFVVLNATPTAGRLLNAFLAWGAACLLYRTLREYVTPRAATMWTYALGLFPLLLEHLPLLMSETLAVFLVCAALRVYIRLSRQAVPRVWQFGLLALTLAALALTKVLYGYVLLTGFVFAALVYLVRRTRIAAQAAIATALALLLCAPYLVHTYALTGRPFYWSSSGGLSLYWMSSPYPGDLGDWYGREIVARTPWLAVHHGAFFERLDSASAVERDEALRREAWRNIANHPAAYLRNVVANAGRLLFNYPFSHGSQNLSKLLHIVPGAYVLTAMTAAFVLTVRGGSGLPAELRAVLAFGAIAFGGSCLLSAYNRMLLPLLPIVVLWVSNVTNRAWGKEPADRAATPGCARIEEAI
jgi:hypothetical protein